MQYTVVIRGHIRKYTVVLGGHKMAYGGLRYTLEVEIEILKAKNCDMR